MYGAHKRFEAASLGLLLATTWTWAQLGTSTALAAPASLGPRPVAERPVEGYNGTALGVGVGPTARWAGGRLAAGGALRAHLSLLLQILDVGIDAAGSGPRQAGGAGWSLGVAIRIHPLFPTLVRQRFVDYLAAGFYAQAGGHVTTGPDAWAAGPVLGVGFDVPLGKPSGSRSWWLGAVYTRHWDWRGSRDFHAVTAVVEVRWHGLRWGHLPRPTEFDFSPMAHADPPDARTHRAGPPHSPPGR